MRDRVFRGFTIIEVVLFLGVTGLLVTGVMVGVGTNVSIQRYRDATETFKSSVQAFYSDATNVQNGRTDNQACNSVAAVTDDLGGDERGQSKCVIIGRYVRIVKNDITSYSVIAREIDTFSPSTGDTDISLLRNKYHINVSLTDSVKKTMEWGTEITKHVSSTLTTDSTALLIIRSPDSGEMYTFSSDIVPTDDDMDNLSTSSAPYFIRDMIVGGAVTPGQAAQVYCIKSNGLFDNGQMALYIAPFAASSNAVELISNDTLKNKGYTYTC